MSLEEIKKQISPGVFLYKSQTQGVTSKYEAYIFKVEVKILKIVEIECDFTGSKNIDIKEPLTTTLRCSEVIEPFQPPTLVAHLELKPEWKLKSKFKLTFKSPSKEMQARWMDAETKSINAEIVTVGKKFEMMDVSIMASEDIQNNLSQSHLSFLDLDFLPVEVSILGNLDRTLLDETLTQWRRPGKFLKQPYSLIYRIQPNVLVSGKLGNDSFYSVLRCLSHKPQLVQRLFFNNNTVNPYSFYKLRLCVNGEWQSVILDDFIPCEPIGDPKFVRSTQNQLWPMLLEKAYAKMYTSYFAIKQISVQDVFEDLTGCPTFTMSLDFSHDQLMRIHQILTHGSLVSLYSLQESREFEDDDFNPVGNRAYPLIGLAEDHKNISVSTQKGEISMQIEEAKAKFKMACVCDITNWEQVRIKGKFINIEHSIHPDQTNYVSKWYYTFEIQTQTQISLCLHQQDIHIGQNAKYKPYLWVSLVLYKKGHNSVLVPSVLSQFSNQRSIYLDIVLSQGNYVVVPVTISQPESAAGLPQKQMVNDIFRKLDLLMTRELKFSQIKNFCNAVREPINQEKYLEMLKKYSKSKSFGISTFKKMWSDHSHWAHDVQKLSEQRLFILSLHSRRQISIVVKDSLGTDLNNRSHVAIIRKYGQEIKTKYKQASLYILKNFNSVTYMVENNSGVPLNVQLDCSKSLGYNCIPTSGKAKRKLQASQCQFVMQLIPHLSGALNNIINQQQLTVSRAD